MHYLIRPADLSGLFRLDGNRWIPDDGRYGTAFAGLVNNMPTAFYPRCKCNSGRPGSTCPADLAMAYASKQYGAGNGVAL